MFKLTIKLSTRGVERFCSIYYSSLKKLSFVEYVWFFAIVPPMYEWLNFKPHTLLNHSFNKLLLSFRFHSHELKKIQNMI